MSDFSNRLRDLRAQKGLTQEEVASNLYVTKQAVSKWENDNSLPDVASLDKLAKFYDVSIDYLLTGEDNVKYEKEIQIIETERLIEVERDLTDAERERINYKLKDIERRLIMGAAMFIMFTIMLIVGAVVSLSLAALVFLLPIAIITPITIYNYRCYKKEKAELEKIERNHNNKSI